MARDTMDVRPIESVDQLADYIAEGEKPPSQWRIGTEHEKFTFFRDTLKPVPYSGENGIGALLEKVRAETGWTPNYDGEAVIGLNDPKGGGSISLEPGGQFELSGAPLENLHQTCAETSDHLRLLRRFTEPMGIDFLGLGVTPTWSLSEIPAMPKSRYGIMTPYMEKVGTLGTSMMYRSCTVQVNLDFASEADMVQKLRVGLALQPIATALFANSPFLEGKPNGYLSFRSHIWLNTDNARTGMLPFAFEEGMGFERYADHALDVPMYFVIRDGKYVNCAGESFRDFLEGKLPQLPGEKPTVADWEDHLSTLFPEVRMKQFLEMRGADGGPWEGICALPAFWVGLLYDQSALDAAWDLVKDWTDEERETLRRAVPKTALHTPFRDGSVMDIARQAVDIARAGLKARAKLNWEGADEAIFLKPLDYTLQTGKTPAERLLDLYHGPWNEDVTRVFRDQAMGTSAA